jgi:2-polyprenyl-6-methoxyphenol hydroxylase-like FAD-dependent oxidoreductase/acetyl esterase/lipase
VAEAAARVAPLVIVRAQMRVIVAGGGIGGMAAAVALAKVGARPLVLEQAGADREIGAGLGLAANAMKALTWLGAADFVRERAVLTEANVWCELESGAQIGSQPLRPADERYGEHYYCAHRGDLLESLVRLVPAERVRLDARVVGFEERPNGVTVRLDGGEEVEGDLLVGADGLRSRVRAALFGEEEARFTGTVTWRALVPREQVPEKFGPRIVVWLGPNRHSMLYPVRRDLFNLSGFVPAEEVHREVWAPSPDTDDLRRSFVGACHDVTSLIEQAGEALITPIYFRDPLDVWGTERVVLLGDAAHPSPPSAGMGAAMALEDAVVLARCIERHGDGAAAFADYASLRMARTRRMLVASRNNLAFFNEPDPAQMRGRNGRFVGMQRLDPVGETGTGWLYEYDAATAAQAAPPSAPPTLRRSEARRAADLWRNALTLEDRAGLWRGERAGYDRFLRLVCPPPEGVEVEALACDGVAALGVVPAAGRADGPAVLHVHGGGFVLGSAQSSVGLAARVAAAIGGWTLVPDYRLAPENPFPAALDDVHTAYRWLVEQGTGAVALSGECAGGALAVSLAVRLRDEGAPPPVAIQAVSPLCDLTVSSASTRTGSDPWFNRDVLRLYAASYLHDAEPLSPLVSPVHADLRELPPLLIHAAAGEALLDDAVALARAAEDAGVDVTLRTVADSVHSFVLFDFLPEAHEALAEFAAIVGAASARV